MSDPHLDSGGGGTQVPPDHHQVHQSPDQMSLSYAMAAGGATGGSSNNLRKYAEIIEAQKSDRNVLEVKIKRKNAFNRETNETGNVKSLTFDDISELVFEVLNVQFEDCIGVDYFTGRYDSREIILKPGVDTSSYITSEPIISRSTT